MDAIFSHCNIIIVTKGMWDFRPFSVTSEHQPASDVWESERKTNLELVHIQKGQSQTMNNKLQLITILFRLD